MTNRLDRRIAKLEEARTEDGWIRPVRIIGDTPPTPAEAERIAAGARIIHRVFVRHGQPAPISPEMTEEEWAKSVGATVHKLADN